MVYVAAYLVKRIEDTRNSTSIILIGRIQHSQTLDGK